MRFAFALYRRMLGDRPETILEEFWERALCQPWASAHPVTRDPSALHETYPLLFHYDGAEAYTNAEAHIWSMGSFLARVGNFTGRFVEFVGRVFRGGGDLHRFADTVISKSPKARAKRVFLNSRLVKFPRRGATSGM